MNLGGFKQSLIDENEKKYGTEVQKKYGEDTANRSNSKIRSLTNEQYVKAEHLSQEVNEAIKAAFEQSDPAGELAQRACELHKRWLCYFWDSYSKETYKSVTLIIV